MLPGQEYNADRQCKVAFGFNSTFCGGERVRKRLFWQERMNLNILRERVWTTRYKSDTSSCRLCSSVGDRSRSYMVTEISILGGITSVFPKRAQGKSLGTRLPLLVCSLLVQGLYLYISQFPEKCIIAYGVFSLTRDRRPYWSAKTIGNI